MEARWIGPSPELAPTLVFLHEGLGCIALWKDFPQRMAQATGCSALIYSRAGYGLSDSVELPRSLDYMRHEAEQVLPQVLDATGVQRSVLVGHSDGGSIALIHAGNVSDTRVRALVLMAPHVFNEPVCIEAIEKARLAYITGNLRERLARHHHRNVDVAFWGWNDLWLDPGFLDWDLTALLPSISVPALLIQGCQDEYGSPTQIHAIESHSGGDVESLWPDPCGHIAYRDQPDTIISASVDFLGMHQITST